MRLPDPERSRAVFIGVGWYRHLPSFDASSRAARLHDALTDPYYGSLSPEHCALLPPDAAREEVVRTVAAAARDAEDLLLVYYAGHGLRGKDHQDLRLTVADTLPDEDGFDAIAFDDVRELVLDSAATAKAVLLDCRYSGWPDDRGSAAMAVLDQVYVDGAAVLTTVPPDESEGDPEFTSTLVELLRGGVPDAPEFLTLPVLHRHLRRELEAAGRPVPRAVTESPALEELGLVRNRHTDSPRHATPPAASTGSAWQGAPTVPEDRVIKLSDLPPHGEPTPLAELVRLAESSDPRDRVRAYRGAMDAMIDGRVDPAEVFVPAPAPAAPGRGSPARSTARTRVPPAPPEEGLLKSVLRLLPVLLAGPAAALLLVVLYHDIVSYKAVEREFGVRGGYVDAGLVLITCSALVLLLTWSLLIRRGTGLRALAASADPGERARARSGFRVVRVATTAGIVVGGFLASLGAMLALGFEFTPVVVAVLMVEPPIAIPFLWITRAGRAVRDPAAPSP